MEQRIVRNSEKGNFDTTTCITFQVVIFFPNFQCHRRQDEKLVVNADTE